MKQIIVLYIYLHWKYMHAFSAVLDGCDQGAIPQDLEC